MEILFNSMPYAVLLRNQDGVILNINKKFEEYFHTVKNKIKMVVKTDRPFLSIVNPPQSNKFI